MPANVNSTVSNQSTGAAPQSSALEHFMDVLKTQQQIEDNNEANIAAAAHEIAEADRKREMEGKPEEQGTSANGSSRSSSSSANGTQAGPNVAVQATSLLS